MPIAVRQLEHGRAEALVDGHGRPEASSHPPSEGDGVAFDHEVDVVEMGHAQERVTHDAADHADAAVEVGVEPREHRMRPKPICQMSTIHHVSWDPLSEKLVENSPLRTPELVAAFSRYEHLTITELDGAWDEVNVAFRAWVEEPDNRERPIREAPQYWDRIAIDSLRERRTWWE